MKTFAIAALFVVIWVTSVSPGSAAEFNVKALNHGSNGFFVFDPELIRIKSGDSVRFVAIDKGHEVHSLPGLIPAKAQPFIGKLGEDLDVTFVESGIYVFACRPHTAMGMVGIVVVGTPGNIDEIKPTSLPPKAKAKVEALLAKVRGGS